MGKRCRQNRCRLHRCAYRSLEGTIKADWPCYILAWLLAVATVDAADAQTEPYPNKPVQIIADSSAGSAPDVALRFVADRLTQAWGQQALVVNRPGGGGIQFGAEFFAGRRLS